MVSDSEEVRVDVHIVIYSDYLVYKLSLRVYLNDKEDFKKIDSREFDTREFTKLEAAQCIKEWLGLYSLNDMINPIIKKLAQLERLSKA